MQKIFIIEDDQTIRNEMVQSLKKWNFQASWVQDFQNIDSEIKQQSPDLIIMDITLPFYDGFYWTQKIREFSKIPIMFVSAAEMDPNAIRAISIGADDYLTKPFSVDVFVSKIQAILRRTNQNNHLAETISFNTFSLNIITNVLKSQNESVKLTTTEGTILKLLFLNPDQVISKKKIIKSIWQNGDFTDENILNVNMSRLRDKLGQIGLADKIVTEYGKGYRLLDNGK
ncbi:response regulator [Lentilactobacillus hilgardii]|jgi:DNA-binding response OmpR family regulator|uniref:Response regulator n=3 Tax=Lentilactobacillus hilgardii TaxID=1588 RepID=A0A6P1E5K0_LENHI|nr:response regulator transcription factor [Lentilactobacillus hilgardii]MCT3392424.1 DNA-binding response regulator [Lentilactobacillus hilgardii]QHB51052.1 response regulator [Lentilactobacillus hilgardii]RRG11779.1 MAG: DNA-binding response regulator [Lactobacillus sp.]